MNKVLFPVNWLPNQYPRRDLTDSQIHDSRNICVRSDRDAGEEDEIYGVDKVVLLRRHIPSPDQRDK
jgi:hypothetical protein